jgi:hypothetical protein
MLGYSIEKVDLTTGGEKLKSEFFFLPEDFEE